MITNREKNQLNGKVVLITGASSGIGEEIAYASAQRGYQLVLWARRTKELERVAHKCREISGAPVWIQTVDMSDSSQIEKAFVHILNKTGTVDILINNAGFGHTEYFLKADLKKAENMFDVNVMGALYITQLAAIQMAEQESGHIFFLASMAGKISTPKSSIYSATKAAVIAFCNSLRLELKPLGIYVTTINPGPVDTPFFDIFDPDHTYLDSIGRVVLEADEVAEKVVRTFWKNKREINLPFIMEIGSRLYHLFPTIGDFIVMNVFDRK